MQLTEQDKGIEDGQRRRVLRGIQQGGGRLRRVGGSAQEFVQHRGWHQQAAVNR